MNWSSFLHDTEQIPKPATGIRKPVENVWLIPLPTHMQYASQLLEVLRRHPHQEHKEYMIEDEPQDCS